MSAALIWLAVGILLLVLEVVGTTGFFVGAAVAAVAMALVTWIFELSLVAQVVFYAISATVATFVYIKFFRSSDPRKGEDMHDKASTLEGTQFVIDENLSSGQETRVQLGDTLWRVKALDDIDAGSNVLVAGGSSTVLDIRSVT